MTAPAPAAPTVTSIVFDQSAYSPGQTMTATVNYTQGTSNSTQTFTGTATDNSNPPRVGNLVVNFIVVVKDPTIITGADSGNRTWTKVSDNGTTAVFTATA